MKSVLLALAALACVACAQNPSADGVREEKVFRTGSNLPVRDKEGPSDVKVLDPKTIDPIRRGGGATRGSP